MAQQCRECIYWKPLSSSTGSSIYVCHFLLTVHRRRGRDETGRCLERKISLDKPKMRGDTGLKRGAT